MMKIKLIFILTLILLFLCSNVWGATYNWYFSDDATGNAAGNDSTGDGSITTPWKSLSKANTQIASLSSGDIATLYFDRSDTWTFTSNNDVLTIRKSNVTIDAYGSGAKPIFDGDDSYPTGLTGSDVPYRYAITIANSGTPISTVTNVHINNLNIRNMYPGGGIAFSGIDATNGYFV